MKATRLSLKLTLGLSLALLLGSGAALAQAPAGSTRSMDKEATKPMDKDESAGASKKMPADSATTALLERLHVANQAEIDAGKLAQANGGSRVADYGQMLVTDHTKADEQLTDLSGKMSVKLSDTPTDAKALEMMKDAKAEALKLQALHGAQFDKAFSRALESDHQKVISMIKAARADCRDEALGAMLDQTLPVLQTHEKAARDLRMPTAQGRRP